MRVITLHQPWASWLALGLKKYETRHWKTSVRGELGIHAAKKTMGEDLCGIANAIAATLPEPEKALLHAHLMNHDGHYPLGELLGYGELSNCQEMISLGQKQRFFSEHSPGFLCINDVSPLEQSMGDWTIGRFAWEYKASHALVKGIPVTGSQGFWQLEEKIEAQIRKAQTLFVQLV